MLKLKLLLTRHHKLQRFGKKLALIYTIEKRIAKRKLLKEFITKISKHEKKIAF